MGSREVRPPPVRYLSHNPDRFSTPPTPLHRSCTTSAPCCAPTPRPYSFHGAAGLKIPAVTGSQGKDFPPPPGSGRRCPLRPAADFGSGQELLSLETRLWA